MSFSIGTKIKTLRKAHGLSQEQLANRLGVTAQAVSKWETGLTLPDITLVPALASYFQVTTDELFDFKLYALQARIAQICKDAAAFRENDPQKSRAILEQALQQYPDDEVLQNNLLYVMDYTAHPEETIALAQKLAGQTAQEEIRYDALRFLAYAYAAKGETAAARAAIEQIPELYFTKLTELAFCLHGAERLPVAEKQKWISFENLLQMMGKLAQSYEEIGKIPAAITETEQALHLLSVFTKEVRAKDFQSYVTYFSDYRTKLQEAGKTSDTAQK